MNAERTMAPVTRRAALALLGGGALAGALWPRTPRSRQGVPRGRVEIEYWEKWTGAEGAALDRVIDRFNVSQERIWVRRLAVADIVPKAMVAIAGGDPPDLCGLYSFNIPQLAESRAAMSFDELAPRGGEISPEIYAPSIARLLTYRGRQWAAVTSCYALGLYCNLDHFESEGLPIQELPRTIWQLDGAARRLTRQDRDGHISRTGFQQNLPQWWPYTWPVLFGGTLYDASADRATIGEPSGVAAFTWIQETARRLGVEEGRALARTFDRSYHTPRDPFLSGRASMVVQGPWLANFASIHAPALRFACVPPPVDASVFDPSAPLGMVEADVLVVPRGCRHPREAWEFVSFMQRMDVQEELSKAHGKSSPLRQVSADFTATHPNRSVGAFDAVVKSPRACILPQTRVWQQYADMTSGLFDQAWDGAPVEPALARVQARAQELLDLTRSRRLAREGASA